MTKATSSDMITLKRSLRPTTRIEKAAFFIRLFSIPSLALCAFILADLILPAVQLSQVEVQTKHASGLSSTLRVKSKENGTEYDQHVPTLFHSVVKEGDRIEVKKTRFFKAWKEAEVNRNGQKIFQMRGVENLGLTLLLIAFLIPSCGLVFPLSKTISWEPDVKTVSWILIPLIELWALGLCVRLTLLHFGMLSSF